MNISFDFDNTLDRLRVKEIAIECIDSRYTVMRDMKINEILS